ncbi:MAG TPA: glycosyltransferase family 2 protein [Catalimonadaceae bacterium]|nr:glycosyltransferase family 2 protein [Catalimonadaceae bacterium]
MKLGIVIPALNEEESIEKIILLTEKAKSYIISNSPVTDVDIIVVSDGSTDQTVPLAQKHLDKIKLVIFEKNRGYGAAIKQGWEETDAEFLAFLDADGTCNPEFFAPLCTEMEKGNRDIMLGCRLNKNSEMPAIRRFGNTLFAILLSLVSNQKVRDTASGMRVIRRSSLQEIMPLPDGLHFTPAMSARAILHPDLKIHEIDMPYKERDGESKLKVWKDGIRFLKVILEMTFLYQPQRVFFLSGIGIALLALLLMLTPIGFYFSQHRLEEWMIYRFMSANLLGTLAMLFFMVSFISERIVGITLSGKTERRPLQILSSRFFDSTLSHWAAAILLVTGFILVYHSIVDRLTLGQTYEHWSRYMVMSFFFTSAAIIWLGKGLNFILGLIEERLFYFRKIGK